METLNSTLTKKALIITGINNGINSLLPSITNKKKEELLIFNSFGAVISQPYGCLIRNIILALYNEKVEEIYIIGEEDSKDHKVNKEELLMKIKDAGVSEESINTLNYIDVVNHDLTNWLAGPQDAEDAIKKSIDMISRHPLIPKSIPVYAYIANGETGEYKAV